MAMAQPPFPGPRHDGDEPPPGDSARDGGLAPDEAWLAELQLADGGLDDSPGELAADGPWDGWQDLDWAQADPDASLGPDEAWPEGPPDGPDAGVRPSR